MGELPKEGKVIQQQVCVTLGKQGDGIFRVEGFVLMVNGAIPGKSYDIRVTRVGERYGFAEII